MRTRSLPVLALGFAASLCTFSVQPAAGIYGNKSYLWPGNPPLIPVCWENPTTNNRAARAWVRDAVEKNWARHARVNFYGWGTCSRGAAGLHILAGTRNRAPGGYPGLNGVESGMELDLSRPEAQVRALALHEFGHALGFYHEEERPDYTPAPGAPSACAKQSWPNANPQYYGAYDIDSVMSYCGQPGSDPSTWKQNLSAGDIAAVQTAYRRRIAGTLLSPRANSLSANAFVPGATGARPFLWDGDETADDQEWVRTRNVGPATLPVPRGALFIYPSGAPGARACLHLAATAGAAVEIRDCVGTTTSAPQGFTFENVEIRGYGGKCLDLRGGNTAAGTPVQMWRCLGNTNQKWSISLDGEIRFGGATSNRCVTVASGGTADGTALQIAPCAGAAGQRFGFHPRGEIRYAGKCLDVPAARTADYLAGRTLPRDGVALQLWSCITSQLNQKWHTSGPLKANGACLARTSGTDANGGVPVSAPCNGTSAQVWDYYTR